MKLLSVVILLISFNAFSEVKSVKLTSVDELKVSCPEGNIAQLINNSVSCTCPSETYPRLEGKVLKCESKCVIAVETINEGENCDQGGCFPGAIYDALTVRKNGSRIYNERVYSRYSRETQLLLPEALEAAKRASCFKTFYNGKEI